MHKPQNLHLQKKSYLTKCYKFTPYGIVFGQKSQIPLSFKLSLLIDSESNCNSEFSKDLSLHRHIPNIKDEEIAKLLKPTINN